jgi:hypothetical protein
MVKFDGPCPACEGPGTCSCSRIVGDTPRIFHAANSEFGEEHLIILGEWVLDTEELFVVLHADLCDSQHLLGVKVRGLALTGIDSHRDPWAREIWSESFELSRHHIVHVGRNGRLLLEEDRVVVGREDDIGVVIFFK